MAYERIKAFSKSLGNARNNMRLDSATILLEKLEIGALDKDDSASLATLFRSLHKAIALILENSDDLADRNKETNDLLQALLSIVKETIKDSSRSDSLTIATKILEQLYFLKETEHIVGTVQTAVDKVRSFSTPFRLNLSTAQLTFLMSLFFILTQTIGTLCWLNTSTGFTRSAHVEQNLCTHSCSKFRGAGNLRLVRSKEYVHADNAEAYFQVQKAVIQNQES